MVPEEEYLKESHKHLKHKSTAVQPINTRFIGIKQHITPSPSRSKIDNFPAPSESFVVLPRPDHKDNIITSKNSFDTTATTKITTLQAVGHPATTSSIPAEDPNWSTRNNTLSHRLKVANRVFDIMSSKSSIDHPMCQECTDMLLELLENQMSDVSRERDSYIEFLKKVKDSRVSKEEEKELAKQVEEVHPKT